MKVIDVENVKVWFYKPESISRSIKEKFLHPFKKTKVVWALKGISFKAEEGEMVGIIGENGSGKTTLLRVIGGILPPDEGRVKTKGKIASLIELGIGFHPEFTGMENIFIYGTILGFKIERIKERLEKIVEFSEIGEYINAPLYMYSSGMKARLAMSTILMLEPDIIISDEVYAVADIGFQQKIKSEAISLKKRKNLTFLLVSHDLSIYLELDWDRIIWIRDGKIEMEGKPDRVIKEYKRYMGVE